MGLCPGSRGIKGHWASSQVPHLPDCPWPQACPRGATCSILHPSSWLWADADKPPSCHAWGSRFPRGQAPWSLISAVTANHTHLELPARKLFTYLFIQQTFVSRYARLQLTVKQKRSLQWPENIHMDPGGRSLGAWLKAGPGFCPFRAG